MALSSTVGNLILETLKSIFENEGIVLFQNDTGNVRSFCSSHIPTRTSILVHPRTHISVLLWGQCPLFNRLGNLEGWNQLLNIVKTITPVINTTIDLRSRADTFFRSLSELAPEIAERYKSDGQ